MATSSGSRGVYGAIGTSGEWGLKKGCAVVYTDKGTGIGAHDLERNVAYLINGQGTVLGSPVGPPGVGAFGTAVGTVGHRTERDISLGHSSRPSPRGTSRRGSGSAG